MAARVPPVKYAERTASLFLTVSIVDCKEPGIKLNATSIEFRGRGVDPGTAQPQEFAITIPLCKPIDPAASKWATGPRGVVFVLAKAEPGWWGALLPKGVKLPSLTTDWDKYVDEDDDKAAAPPDGLGDFNFEDMGGMGGGGGFGGDDGGMGGMNEGGGDSDDEDNGTGPMGLGTSGIPPDQLAKLMASMKAKAPQ